ncbi:hypothetical protein [Ferrovibrio sp.]|uniref:hypothetical protein n=1 Tax=Ferrovibrio sp. TaxID=1917215 RepID=UPI002606B13F|nr:hypothetical protein [Ferrovibrio sp.]
MTEDNERGAARVRREPTPTANHQTSAASLLDEYRKAVAAPSNAPNDPPTEEQLAFERKLAGYRARRAAIMGRV